MFSGLKENPIVYLARKVWRYSRGNHPTVILYTALAVGASLINLARPLILAVIFNLMQREGISEQTLPRLCGLLSLLIVRELVAWCFHGPSRVMEISNAFITRAQYKKYLLDGVLGLPMEWHTNHHSGDTIDRVEKGSSRLYSFAESSFLVIRMLTATIGALTALIYFDVTAGLITLGATILTLWVIMRFDRILVKHYRLLNRAENRISEKVVDVITNISTVVILRIQKALSQSIATKMEEPFTLFKKNTQLSELKWFLVCMIEESMVVLVVGYYLYSHVHAGLPILFGTVFALQGYTSSVADTFFTFASLYGDILMQRASVANAEDLATDFQQDRGSLVAQERLQWNELRIEGLTFSYHSDENESDVHLHDVNLSLQHGKKYAVIGATGSGKTTLLKVARDLYHPKQVRVYLDGKLLPDGFRTISSEITLVPQDPEILATTIRDNITLGADYDDAYIRHFTDIARFTDVVERLPRGLDSLTREKGVNLSGGEKQRLALARGMLACADKSIALLDEPTSSVDALNETAIYRNILAAFSDQTVISSIHKLHLLPMFDHIFLFDNGRIVAEGPFKELLKQSGQFRDMWAQYQL